MFRRFLVFVALCSFLGLAPKSVAAEEICFPSDKTPYCFDNAFSGYWRINGGLPVFGYPVTKAANELNRDTEVTYWTQWAERNRFEVHPENSGTPYEILLGRLGADRLAQLGRTPDPREAGAKDGCLWFEITGHNVCNQQGSLGFKTYWENHGLQIPGLDSYARSLQLFGYPLTEPKMETNSSGDTVMTQWFERARFEWHPNNPDEFKVLLGLLGREVYQGRNQADPGTIVFMSDRASSGDIYTIKPDGSDLVQLTKTSNIELAPTWSPDRSKIAFVRYEGAATNLYVMNADGSNVTRLDNRTGLIDTNPTWSPDGKQLAFIALADRTTDIYVIDADGKNRTRVAQTTTYEIDVKWSPDGKSLGFIATRESNLGAATDVFTINLASKEIKRLTDDVWTEYELDWSPDGSKIAFSAFDGGGVVSGDIASGNVFVINADGSGRTQLTTTNGRSPNWSPDGKQLVYFAPNEPATGLDLFIMNNDGSNKKRLTTVGNNIDPDWSR